MAIDIWNGNGNWATNASDWSTGSPPSSNQDAEIASGDATLSGAGAADVLTVLDEATLTMTGAASLTVAGQLDQLGSTQIDTGSGDGGAKVAIAGALVNGNSLTIGNSSLDAATTVTAASLANSGSIALWGNSKKGTTDQSTLDITGAAPATLTGSIYLHGDSLLEFGSGGITAIAAGAELQLDGAQSRVAIGAGTTNSALSGLHVNAGTLDLEGNWSTGPGGTSVTTTTSLNNTHDLQIDVYGGDGASSLSIGGELVNSGSVDIGNSSLSASSTLTAAQIDNAGSITLWGDDKLKTTNQSTLHITGSFSGVITGNYYLHGDALLELASGVTTIASGDELQLDGQLARVSIGSGTTNSGLATLKTINGTFDMEGNWTTGPGGSSVTTTGALTNSGALDLDTYNGDGASSLTIGGALVNSGSVKIGNSSLSASSTVKADGLTNTGSITLWGDDTIKTTNQATLDITSVAPTTLTGQVYLHGDSLLEFASGGIYTIGYGAELQLDGQQSRLSIGSGTTNSGLATLKTINGTFDIEGDWTTGPGGSSVTTTGTLTNAGALDLDVYNGDGDSSLTIGGALVNSGSVKIGNSYLSASSTVQADGLTNSGSITLWGDETLKTTNQATLDITTAAPSTLTGDVYLHGDSLLEFASGGIASIGYGAELQLDGQQSRVSIGSGTTNSGLTTLRTNYGTFDMEGDWGTGPGGSSVTTSGALTNTGTLQVDVYNGDGDSSLKIGGALLNSGNTDIGNTFLSATTNVTASSLTNTNTIVLQGNAASGATAQATLDITGAAPSTTSDSYRVGGDALLEFGSGGITTVGYGSWFELDGSEARASIGAGTTSSALKDLATNNGTLDLRGNSNYGAGGVTVTTSVGYDNYGATYVDGQYNGDGGSRLTIGGGLTNNGTFDIGNLYLSAATKVTATSLTNNGSLVVAGATSNAAMATLDITGAAPAATMGYTRLSGDALLEFASGDITSVSGGTWFELDGATAVASIGAGTTNSALKDLANNYGTLVLRGDSNLGAGGVTLTTSVGFTNYGTAYIDGEYNGDAGSQVAIGDGLNNQGTLDIGNLDLSAATKVTATGLANNGSLVVAGAASNAAQTTLDITGAAPATTMGYTRLSGDALLEFASGAITSVTGGTWFELDGATAVASIGAGTTNSALKDLATNYGTLDLRGDSNLGAGGVTLATSVGFTNYGTGYVDGEYNGDGGSQVTIGGGLTNNGTLDIGNLYLSAATKVTATTLTNNESLVVAGAASNAAQATLDITGAAPAATMGYTRLSGDALLEFASGAITSVTGGTWFELDGATAVASIGAGTTNSALKDLATNYGTLALRGDSNLGAGGVTLTTSVGLTNCGTAYVDGEYNGDGGSQVSIGGALNNQGALNIGNLYLSATTKVTATSFANTGSLTLVGGNGAKAPEATLDITGAAGADVYGYYRISGNALLEFASGAITNIKGGAWFELDGSAAVASIGAGTTNTALTKLSNNDGTLMLRGNSNLGSGGVTVTTTTALANNGAVYVDGEYNGDGGSDFTIGGALTNNGAFNEGNGYLSAATSVSATELINNGTVDLLGGSGASATMTISGQVANDGSVTIGAHALLSITGAGHSYTQTGGSTTIAGGLSGALNVDGGGVDFTTAVTSSSPTGAMTIADGGTLEFAAGADSSHTVTFADTTGTLDLGAPGSFASAIKGFADGDVIDLLGTAATTFTYTSDVLKVYDNSTLVATLNMGAGYSQSSFALASDGSNGTDILDPKTTSLAARAV